MLFSNSNCAPNTLLVVHVSVKTRPLLLSVYFAFTSEAIVPDLLSLLPVTVNFYINLIYLQFR
jgi:hypothetical protein